MKFIKGIVIGGIITTGIIMMHSESDIINKKKLAKRGKRIVKKIGIM